MHTERLQLGSRDRLRVTQIKGDLRLTGQDGAEMRIQVGDEGSLTIQRQAGWVELDCRGGCLLFLPKECEIVIGKVAGDLRAHGLTSSLEIENVGGNLNLREMARVNVSRVGGDLAARKISGLLQAASVGGDALLEDLQGEVSLGEVGGDVGLRKASSSVALNAGGDVRLEFSPAAGTHSVVRAGGDLRCVLPVAASVWIEIRASGDMTLPSEAEPVQEGERTRLRLGSGAAEIALDAGGDVSVLQAGEAERREEIDVFLEEINVNVRAQVDGAMAAAASSLKSLESLPDGATIARQIQESLRSAGFDRSVASPAPAARSRSAPRSGGSQKDNPEQIAILNMLQAGKINTQEAEMLLRALEAGS
ncbi:MAG: hypothetical protein MUO23_09575 [Anaerolineales bacterium]|nr:hypothetical protein [Anaerolineales bacterium]